MAAERGITLGAGGLTITNITAKWAMSAPITGIGGFTYNSGTQVEFALVGQNTYDGPTNSAVAKHQPGLQLHQRHRLGQPQRRGPGPPPSQRPDCARPATPRGFSYIGAQTGGPRPGPPLFPTQKTPPPKKPRGGEGN